MVKQNQFLFLYPIDEYLEYESKKYDYPEAGYSFQWKYRNALNSCINFRYRKNDFGINFVVFDDTKVSDIIIRNPEDNIIKTGSKFGIKENFSYANPDFLIDSLDVKNLKHLRVAGFHVWDCVEKVAKRAYERKIDVLVDEDLTEFLSGILVFNPEFNPKIYPGRNPKVGKEKHGYEMFLEVRKERPWLLQEADYQKAF